MNLSDATVSFVCEGYNPFGWNENGDIYDTPHKIYERKGQCVNSIDGTILFDFRRSRVKLSPRRDSETSEIAGCNIIFSSKRYSTHELINAATSLRDILLFSQDISQAVFMSSQNRRGGVSSIDT